MAHEETTRHRTFGLEIITPERIVVEDEVEGVVLSSPEGFYGILRNHAPFIGGLNIGVLKYRKEGKLHWVATDNGVFEMSGNKLRIMADAAERGEDINVLRAKEAYERAKRRLAQKHEGLDYLRAELALKRSMARLKAATGEKSV
ncbi:MAG: ATP synthase F1 subunit epsilon [Thermacetogeniaceae bacterium]|jgi:F-type H+-transporting ATPase subunit epsilon